MMTTAQRIALRFALTIAGIVLFLGLVINGAFFGSWWKREQGALSMQTQGGSQGDRQQRIKKKFAQTKGDFGSRNTLIVMKDGEEHRVLEEHTLYRSLAHFEDEWYLYGEHADNKHLIVMDISPVVHNQIALLWITLFAMVGLSVLGYFLTVQQVKRGLNDLHVLATHVQGIDINSLQKSVAFDHLPEYDEIHIVSRAIDDMTTKLHHQVSMIKQFVANVSHEFKTPLMSLQSTLEVGEKTKNYENVLSQTREQIGVMNRLLETLTILTNVQHTTEVEKNTLNVAGVLTPLIRPMQEKYPHIHFTQTIDLQATIFAHQGFLERIVSNVLDNAGKFTPVGGTVSLVADAQGIQITDSGPGISPEQFTRIREPFWQGDAARGTEGFGLGLALVKQLVTLLDWEIVVKSTLGEGTTVTIKR